MVRTIGLRKPVSLSALPCAFKRQEPLPSGRAWTGISRPTVQDGVGIRQPMGFERYLPVRGVLIVKVLEPIWPTKTETASRVRARIESVLDWAAARDYRSAENPERWKGSLSKLFPARLKVRAV